VERKLFKRSLSQDKLDQANQRPAQGKEVPNERPRKERRQDQRKDRPQKRSKKEAKEVLKVEEEQRMD
jgi:hypothetical protein